MLGALSGLHETITAYLALSSGLGCYTFPDTVLSQTGQGPRATQAGLSDHGENYLQAFGDIVTNLQAWSSWKQMLAALRRLDPSVKSVELRMPGREKIVVSHDVGGAMLPFDLEQESEGLRRFLVYLIALYQIPPKQTLIFEEPEKGIHPGALAVLADQFKAAPAADRGQVILTTHSPDLLNHLPPESIRVVEMRDSVTHIGPVDPGQVEAIRDQLLRPGELLTVDTARLAEAPAAGS
jgi:hypothetical protein